MINGCAHAWKCWTIYYHLANLHFCTVHHRKKACNILYGLYTACLYCSMKFGEQQPYGGKVTKFNLLNIWSCVFHSIWYHKKHLYILHEYVYIFILMKRRIKCRETGDTGYEGAMFHLIFLIKVSCFLSFMFQHSLYPLLFGPTYRCSQILCHLHLTINNVVVYLPMAALFYIYFYTVF